MPSFVNGTHVSSAANTSTSLSNYTLPPTIQVLRDGMIRSGNLGYGIGRILRGAFDQVWSTWQNWWNPAPSQDEIALQKQVMIYKQGLAECVTHLDRAIDNLRKNPNDPQSLEKIKKLAAHYERYVQPAPTEELSSYQKKLLGLIAEKISSDIAGDMQNELKKILPILDLDRNAQVSSKIKRSIQQLTPLQRLHRPLNLLPLQRLCQPRPLHQRRFPHRLMPINNSHFQPFSI